MRSRIEYLGCGLAITLLAACGSGRSHGEPARLSSNASGAAPVATDYPVVLGQPYAIGGKTFSPADTLNFDEVGRASIRSPEGEGQATASGVPYAAGAVTAAHRTLPLPSYVEVTSLTSGETILVRVIDRGPMDLDHVITLSPGAAAQLGISSDNEPVRVRRVNPPEQERAALRFGGQAPKRLETPAGLRSALLAKLSAQSGVPVPAPTQQPIQTVAVPAGTVAADAVPAGSSPSPRLKADEIAAAAGADFSRPAAPVIAPKPTPIASKPAAPSVAEPAKSGRFAVQLAALSSREKAEALAAQTGGFVVPAGSLFRVRTGPYATQAQANAAANALHSKGFPQAHMVANDGR